MRQIVATNSHRAVVVEVPGSGAKPTAWLYKKFDDHLELECPSDDCPRRERVDDLFAEIGAQVDESLRLVLA